MSVVLCAMSLALTQGFGTDIELVRPTFGHQATLGMETPTFDEKGTVRWAAFTQYEKDPLIAYELDRDVGAVVSNRQSLMLGVSADVSDMLGIRVVLPFNAHWGADVPQLAADGFGAGDLSLGGRIGLVQDRALGAALHADVMIPTSTADAYMGEPQPRATGGVVGSYELKRFTFLADASLMGRAPVETAHDFTLGPQLIFSGEAVHPVYPGQAALALGVVTRSALSSQFWAGGAENASELLAGMQLFPREDVQLDLGVGKGLADGVGTSEFRGMFGVTWIRRPVPAVRETVVRLPPNDVPEIRAVIEEPEDWAPDELARVEESQIVIRDPIQFELGTDRVLPLSQPTLKAVATIMLEHPEIGHLIIEGHASEEGTYDYNYNLSNLRARSIFRELVRGGVHPKRMSSRGMGEVEPVKLGDEEDQLSANRRVEFHITHYLHHTDDVPVLPKDIRYPWSGEAATLQEQDQIPEPAPVTPDDVLDPTQFTPSEDDEE